MKISLMIEGQNGLNWKRWKNICQCAEENGFSGIFRSDHFTNANPPDKDSLELWVSLTWLAGNASSLEFGPLVTPMSFRSPVFTARMAAAVDDLSGGRLVLGLGAGWQEREHEMFGWDLLDTESRFRRFEEGIQVVVSLLQSDQRVNFEGQYFTLKDAVLLPRPKRNGGPPILLGGNSRSRTLAFAAMYADHWNALFLPPERLKELNRILDGYLEEQKRKPEEVERSLMAGCISGATASEVERKVSERSSGKTTIESLRERGVLVGTFSEIREQIKQIELAGIDQIMVQWLDLDDLKGLEQLAEGIIQ